MLLVFSCLRLLFLILIRLRLYKGLFEAILCLIGYVGYWVAGFLKLQKR